MPATENVLLTFLLLFQFITARRNDLLNNFEKTPSAEMQNFIKQIVAQNSAEKYGIVYVIYNQIPEIYNGIVMRSIFCNSSAYVLNLNTQPSINLKIGEKHFKIAVGDPLGDVSTAQKILKQQVKSRAKTLLLLTNRPTSLLILFILKMYWSVKSLNIIIAFEDDDKKIKVVTYDPFLTDKRFLNDMSDNLHGKYLFYNKLVNLNRHPIKALFTNLDRTKITQKTVNGKTVYSGKDFMVIDTIVKHLNATLTIIKTEDVLKDDETNPWLNSIKHVNRTTTIKRIVESNNIAVLLQSQIFDVEDGIFENIYPHAQDDLCVIVAKSEQLSFFHELNHIFNLDVFIIHLTLPVVFTFLWVFVKRLVKTPYRKTTVFFHVIQALFTNVCTERSKNDFERLILFTWLHYSLIINISLQTKLTSILTKKSYAPDIDKIEDLLKSNMKIYGFENQINEISKKYVGAEQSIIKEKFVILPQFLEQLSKSDMLYNSNFVEKKRDPILIYYDHAIFVTRSRHYRSNGRPWAHLMRESILPSYRSFKVTIGSPYYDTMCRILRRLQEAGLITLWSRQVLYEATIQGLLYPDEDYDDLPKMTQKLKIGQIFFAFYLLLGGLTLSTLIFITEIIYEQYKEAALMRVLQNNYIN